MVLCRASHTRLPLLSVHGCASFFHVRNGTNHLSRSAAPATCVSTTSSSHPSLTLHCTETTASYPSKVPCRCGLGNVLQDATAMATGLKNPVSIRLEAQNSTAGQCMYWLRDIRRWSKRGCTSVMHTDSSVECRCTHLSRFAVHVVSLMKRPPKFQPIKIPRNAPRRDLRFKHKSWPRQWCELFSVSHILTHVLQACLYSCLYTCLS